MIYKADLIVYWNKQSPGLSLWKTSAKILPFPFSKLRKWSLAHEVCLLDKTKDINGWDYSIIVNYSVDFLSRMGGLDPLKNICWI